MRVALNLLYLIPSVVGGTETYAVSLIHAMAGIDADNEYLVFVSADAAESPITPAPNFRRVVCGFRATRRPVRYAWEQLVLPHQLARWRVDLVHSLGYVGPLRPPCPHVVTIHDLNYRRQGESMSPTKRRLLGHFVEQTAVHADHVLTVSDFSRGEIATELGVDAARITVARNAGRLGAGTAARGAAARYHTGDAYVAAFSSSSAHKNIDRLIAAFARLAPAIPHRLVLIGHQPAHSRLAQEAARHGVADRVAFVGYVPDEDVLPLMRGADLFVFPSLYEGFGLPVLDAHLVGVPVACSSAGALPEVAGAGALLFDPLDVDAITAAMARGLRDTALRERLRRAGAENLKRFSWADTARTTLRVYERCVRRSPQVGVARQ